MQSVSDILKKNSVLEPTDEEGNKTRGTAHEFQDYAYRLAKDLNDLEHLTIYMSLVKKVDRHIIERAFQYVADSDIDNRGKLFMWKLKQIREIIEKEKNITNFEYDFVKKRIRKFRDVMAKSDLGKSSEISELRRTVKKQKEVKRKKALVVGCTHDDVLVELVKNEYKVVGIDISPKIVKKAKEKFEGAKSLKFYCKDIFEKSFGKLKFNLIHIGNYWQNIPLQEEERLMILLKEVSSKNAFIIVEIKRANKEIQQWNEITKNSEEIFYLSKNNTFSAINDRFAKHNLRNTKKIELRNEKFEIIYETA